MSSDFHRLAFDTIDEAAAFVAALSRQLDAPRTDLRGDEPIEVGVVVSETGADVSLSPGAIAATERAFGASPITQPIVEIPSGTVWVITNGSTQWLSRDDVLRALAREPPEPLYTRRTSIGTVKYWRNDKGHGVIACEDTAPWDIWVHFGAIERKDGRYRSLVAGQRVEVEYHRGDQVSFKYVADLVRPIA